MLKIDRRPSHHRYPRAPNARRGDARIPAHRRRDAHGAAGAPRHPQHPPRHRRPAGGGGRPLLHPRPGGGDRATRGGSCRCASGWGDRLELVMRVYFEKPRTTVGLEGPDQRPRARRQLQDRQWLAAGALAAARDQQSRPAGGRCEFLDMATPQYFADLVAWGAIGARTTESQVHRELASGLSCPVGFKNGTDGNVRDRARCGEIGESAAPFPGGDQGRAVPPLRRPRAMTIAASSCAAGRPPTMTRRASKAAAAGSDEGRHRAGDHDRREPRQFEQAAREPAAGARTRSARRWRRGIAASSA